MDHPYDFRVPNFTGEVDPGTYLAATPESATCKGLYFQHRRLSFALVPRLFPGVPTRQAFREMGWNPYYIGVVEGTVRHYGFQPDVRIHSIDIANAVLDIRW